jgi:TRAP-type transport system periplasmic protein
MKKGVIFSVSVIVVLLALSLMAACAPAAPAPAPSPTPAPAPKTAELIKFKAVQFLPMGNSGAVPFKQLVDKINETAKGQLQIDVIGGPEAIPPTDQPEAVRKGAVDMVFSMYANFRSIVPLAGFINMTRIGQKDMMPGTPWYDMAVENFAKSNIRYLWEGAYVVPFYLYSVKPVNSPSELKGLRIRSTAAYPFLKDIGTTPITLEHDDIYSAVQTGLIDGMAGKNTTFVEQSLWEVMKYVIGPPFWGTANMGVMSNQDSWNKLPKPLQDLVIDAVVKTQVVKEKENQAYLDNDWNKMKAKGVQYPQWSDADNKWFLDTIDGVMFKRAETALTPEVLAKFKKLGGF